ncbi:hypothetical protein BLOT_002976 [Blomia tropicalis]|nr:hypothetical protein BLOT_002976 [Blomia tropicalis]
MFGLRPEFSGNGSRGIPSFNADKNDIINVWCLNEYKLLAFELLADYIGSELEHQLRTKLSIPDKEMKLLSETTSKIGDEEQ